MSKSKLIALAKSEVGYLEKKSNKNLYSKTANAGYNNYTKMWDVLKPSYQGQPWCDAAVSYWFYKLYGKEKANEYLCGGLMSFYTPTSANYYKKAGRWHTVPKKGDQIFFKDSSGGICHTGLVYKVTGAKVYTIEGNTSASAGVVPNGGGVALKSYARSYDRIAGYGRPKYPAYEYEITHLRYLYPSPKVIKKQRIVKVPKGSKGVTYAGKKSGDWRYVKFSGKKGWIYRKRRGKYVVK